MNINELKKVIDENKVEFVNLRFSGIDSKFHHFSFSSDYFLEACSHGIGFDGSSIPGWKDISKSDMIMLPDLESCFLDPFAHHKTLNIICDIKEPNSIALYDNDPRAIAKRAEAAIKEFEIADTAYFGPEPEFFIFEDVKFKASPYSSSFSVDSYELPINSDKSYPENNNAYRSLPKGGYLLSNPNDVFYQMRSEMAVTLREIGIEAHLHHHEVSPSQSEIGFKFSTLVNCADNVQKFKYIVHNIAASYGKSVTFMPKPVFGENGSGMHVHVSLWNKGKNLFAGSNYAKLSDDALYFIGGVIKHGKALNAFCNPTTNSYKRLVPGYEAPVNLVYSACNRSASIRIPYASSNNSVRVEFRFPDPTANPYLCFAAILMAGIDGIKNKISPNEPVNENLYKMSEARLKKIPKLASSLEDALINLDKDRSFLLEGGVFTNGFINDYIALKMEEYKKVMNYPTPIEYALYY